MQLSKVVWIISRDFPILQAQRRAVSQGRRMVRSGVPLCGLARVLRQHRHNECDDGYIGSVDCFRVDLWRSLRSSVVLCLEAQSLNLPEAVDEWGSSFICQRCGAVSLQ
jgi:hypothetical protein